MSSRPAYQKYELRVGPSRIDGLGVFAALINLPGNALGSASTIITGRRLGKGQIGQAERQLRHVFWLSTIGLTAIAWGTAPFAGLMASFYTHENDVKEVVKVLIWLNAAFMPIWAASWA